MYWTIVSLFRTGKRSTEGLIQDGLNSCIRYIKNNFLDGPRQDSYDLVTGAWTPRKGQEYNWRDERDAITRFVRISFEFRKIPESVSFLTFCFNRLHLLFLLLSLYFRLQFGYLNWLVSSPLLLQFDRTFTNDSFSAYLASPTKVLLLSLILAAAASLHMFNNGIDYVAWPRLVVLDETLNYAGKGFECVYFSLFLPLLSFLSYRLHSPNIGIGLMHCFHRSGRRGRPIREHAVNNGRSSSKRESVLPQTSSAKRD